MQFRLQFTLRDLLVAIVVVAVGLAVLAPFVQRLREQARLQSCKARLRQIGLAMHEYHDVFTCMPPGIVADSPDLRTGRHSGWTVLLPYLDRIATYNAYNFDSSWSEAANGTAIAQALTGSWVEATRVGPHERPATHRPS